MTKKSVAQCIDPMFAKKLDDEILGIPAESVVGSAVIEICKRAAALVAPVTLKCGDEIEEGAWEDDLVRRVIKVTIEQCNVWYFG